MKQRLAVLGIASVLVFPCTIGDAQGQQQQLENTPIFVPVYKAGFKQVAPGISRAVLWGDHDKGPYGAFTRFEAELDAGVHAYANDVCIVVVQGAYVYKDDAGEKRVGPGDFIWIPGGTKHRSGGDAKWGAVFYEESSALAFKYGTEDARGQQQQPKNGPIFAPVDGARFKEVTPGVSKAVLWGDHDKGPYGAFTKFAPELDAGVHTHTNDVWIVVIEGAYLYKDDAGEKRVAPGDFIRIPGGTKHRSGGDKKWGALFYEESNGKFDLVPVKWRK